VWDGDPVPADMVADPEDADGFLVPMRLEFVYRTAGLRAEPPRPAQRADAFQNESLVASP
jgi:hypothetical protein